MIFSNILNLFVSIFKKIKEKKEEEAENILISKIFFIRHGKSHYKEYTCGEKKIDLCPEGIRQIEKTAYKLSRKVNKDLSVFLISSPRIRARNTAKIIKEFLTFEDVEIISNKIFETKCFEAVRLNKDSLYKASFRLVRNYQSWISDSYNNELIETHENFCKRVKYSFKKSVNIIRKKKKNKQFILVAHGEIFDSFMLGFHLWTEYKHKNSLENGEIVEVQVFPKKVVILHGSEKYTLNS